MNRIINVKRLALIILFIQGLVKLSSSCSSLYLATKGSLHVIDRSVQCEIGSINSETTEHGHA